MNGIFLIDKPQGISSAKAIAILKRKLSIEKIGHAGTLDPLATGLLVVMTGVATKLSDYLMGGTKAYSGVIKLGLKTSTDDIEGDILEESGVLTTHNAISQEIEHFKGEILQRPPNISSVKIDGKRAYKITRGGDIPDIESRKVKIYKFDIINFDIKNNELSFYIECSSGTYIRSIARDLGERLKTFGCIKVLRREASFPFTINRTKKIEDIKESDLIPIDSIYHEAKKINLDSIQKQKILNGLKGEVEKILRNFLNNDSKIELKPKERKYFLLNEADKESYFALVILTVGTIADEFKEIKTIMFPDNY